ncbi:MAG: hypothetical protein HOE54_08365 [Gammaproteobacteria bacterium]|jgi:hypothetical protein|nr:hypothetical protein [Gammaproteobacteria bacterium]MBT7371010.1 hypothetical protein [Gammaproteobacteria bacterium]
MMVLDSVQLLDAVKRSLSSNVLPALEDEFARVQIAAALKLLEEVSERLEKGDPCDDLNRIVVSDLTELTGRLQKDDPETAKALQEAVASAGNEDGPREYYRQLVEGVWAVSKNTDPETHAEILNLLINRNLEAAEKDARWICPEALMSLI